jgi:short-subunit dehydrogenase
LVGAIPEEFDRWEESAMTTTGEFRARYGPWAVIAGGTTGVGESYSRELAALGLNLLIIGLEEENLARLAQELPALHGVEVRTANLDLARVDLLAEMRALTADIEVGLLVYNACFIEIGEFVDIELDAHLKALDVNCRGPLILSHLLGGQMAERGRGGILLMASASACHGTGMIASYSASKSFDIALGEALWEELRHRGVDVLALVAGAMTTPGFRKMTPREKEHLLRPMNPDDVARQALAALGEGPVKIPGLINRIAAFVTLRLLTSRRAVAWASARTREVYSGVPPAGSDPAG